MLACPRAWLLLQADLASLAADAALLPLLCQMLDEDLYAESRAAAAAAAGDLLGTLSANPSPNPPAAQSPDDHHGADVHMVDAGGAAAGDGSDGRVAGAAAGAIDALAPALLKRLDDSSDAVRVAAAGALERLAVCLSTAYGRQGLGDLSGPGSSAGEAVGRCDSHAAAAAAALLVRAMQALRRADLRSSCRAFTDVQHVPAVVGHNFMRFRCSCCAYSLGNVIRASGSRFAIFILTGAFEHRRLSSWRVVQCGVCRCMRKTRHPQWQPPHAGPHAHSRRPRPRLCMQRR